MNEYTRSAAASFCKNRNLPLIDHEVLAGVIDCCVQNAMNEKPKKETTWIGRLADKLSPPPRPGDI